MRVCFLIDELATAGTETQLLALIRRLDRGRVQPYLCLLRGEAPSSRALEPDDCPVLRLGVGSLRRPATLLQAVRFIRFLRRERIDVVQAYFPDSSYFGLPAAWLAGVPHRLRTRNNLGHWLTPLHRRLGRLLNAVTTGTRRQLRRRRATPCWPPRGRGRSRSRSWRTASISTASWPCRRCRPRRRPPRRVGAAANLRPVKGLDVLVDAAARLARRASRSRISQ